MKIDNVIISSDNNPYYLDFWPIVSKIWRLKFDITPILLYVDKTLNTNIDTTYGNVIHITPIDDIPIYFQCQIIRFWYLTQLTDKINTIGDIDMLPISKKYFIDSIKNIPDNRYVHLDPRVETYKKLPANYHIAKGDLFKKVFQLPETHQECSRYVASLNLGRDLGNACNGAFKNKIHWIVDEEWSTRQVFNYKPQNIFTFIPRKNIKETRLDRTYSMVNNRFLIDIDKLIKGEYYDYHAHRPYIEHKDIIDTIADIILKY